jgi:hypothetical protein
VVGQVEGDAIDRPITRGHSADMAGQQGGTYQRKWVSPSLT